MHKYCLGLQLANRGVVGQHSANPKDEFRQFLRFRSWRLCYYFVYIRLRLGLKRLTVQDGNKCSIALNLLHGKETSKLRPSHTGLDNKNENENVKNAQPKLVE